MKKVICWSFLLVLVLNRSALANNPPSGQSMLGEISILPVMALLTLIGGGYAVLKKIPEESYGVSKLVIIPVVVLLIFFSAIHEGMPGLLGFFFSAVAIRRGVKMIKWGLDSRPGCKRADHLIKANPMRLIPSGVALILATAFFMGMIVAFTGSFMIDRMNSSRERELKDFVAFQLASAQLEISGAQGTIQQMAIYRAEKLRPSWGYEFKFESDDEGNDFRVYLFPDRMPIFPYNYLTSRPSYYADGTGKIRMIRVRKPGKLCTPDAPVVMQVNNDDVQTILQQMIEESKASG